MCVRIYYICVFVLCDSSCSYFSHRTGGQDRDIARLQRTSSRAHLEGMGSNHTYIYCCNANLFVFIVQRHFKRDEFLGRINEMVYFIPFSRSELNRLVERELDLRKERVRNQLFNLNCVSSVSLSLDMCVYVSFLG